MAWRTLTVVNTVGRAVTQADRHWLVTAEAQGQFPLNLIETGVGRSATGTGFPLYFRFSLLIIIPPFLHSYP